MNKLTAAELQAHLGTISKRAFLAECEAMRIQAGADAGDNLVAIWATKLTGIACEAFDITATIEASYSKDRFEPIVMPAWLVEILLDFADGYYPEFRNHLTRSMC